MDEREELKKEIQQLRQIIEDAGLLNKDIGLVDKSNKTLDLSRGRLVLPVKKRSDNALDGEIRIDGSLAYIRVDNSWVALT
jgi:hypothetical protein